LTFSAEAKLTMTRILRNRIAAATSAIFVAAFCFYLWLFFSAFASRPKSSHPQFGLIHPLNNHGSYVYISDFDVTSLGLLKIVCVLSLILSIAIVPKDILLPPQGTPRWLTYVSASAKTDLTRPSRPLKVIFAGSLFLTAIIIVLTGPAIVGFAVSRGLIVNF
jgi:hypothetical protein